MMAKLSSSSRAVAAFSLFAINRVPSLILTQNSVNASRQNLSWVCTLIRSLCKSIKLVNCSKTKLMN